MKKIFLIALLPCCISAYAQSDDKKLEEINLDTLEVIAPGGPAPYQPAPAREWEIKHTRIALSFNYKARTAAAREWIRLSPYFYPTDSLVLDAKGVAIDSVLMTGKWAAASLSYKYENEKLKIRFGRQFSTQDTIDIFLKYTAQPYANTTKGSAAIRDDRGLYFINTDYKVPNKPAQIWTQGETESNSHWMITIDKPNSRFTSQIELTVPDSFVTLSNGALIKQSKAGAGLRTDIWKMDIPIQAYAYMLAIGKFDIVKEKWRNKEVNYYVEPEYGPYAKLMFRNTPEMIEYFSKRTGVPYPWNKYSQVVVRDYISGAMENTTASLFGEFMNQNAREIADKNSEDVVAHELFHQWFGDYATCESWSNITVNESFANYSEQLWRAHKYGKAAGDELAYNDLQGYIGASQMSDPQLVRFHYDNREDLFDAISYNKGGAILRYLNTLIGDAAFDRAMNLYLTKNALKSTEAHHWRMAVEEATGRDWNWFFNQWYYRGGHPVLKITYNYNDTLQKLKVNVNVTQTSDDSLFVYNLPLKAALIYGSTKTVVDWKLTRKSDSFTYFYKDGVRPVIVPDYEHVLPGEVRDGKKPAQWLAQFMYTDDYISKRLALNGAGKLMSDSGSQAVIDLALNDNNPSLRRLALATIRSAQSDKYRKKWTAKVTSMTADTSNLVRAEAYNVLGEWKVKDAKGKMVAAVNDSSYAVAGNALEALNKIDKDTAYIVAKAMLPTNPKSTLDGTIWSLIGRKGADEDITLLEKKAPYVMGTKKFSFAASLNSYLKNVKSETSFRKALDIYVTLISNEEMKAYRSALGNFLFQVAQELKSNTKSENGEEAEQAQKRLEIVKEALRKVIAAEPDAEAAKEYEKSMKRTFE